MNSNIIRQSFCLTWIHHHPSFRASSSCTFSGVPLLLKRPTTTIAHQQFLHGIIEPALDRLQALAKRSRICLVLDMYTDSSSSLSSSSNTKSNKQQWALHGAATISVLRQGCTTIGPTGLQDTATSSRWCGDCFPFLFVS